MGDARKDAAYHQGYDHGVKDGSEKWMKLLLENESVKTRSFIVKCMGNLDECPRLKALTADNATLRAAITKFKDAAPGYEPKDFCDCPTWYPQDCPDGADEWCIYKHLYDALALGKEDSDEKVE